MGRYGDGYIMKFKWYDWDGEGEIPQGVVGIRYRDGCEALDIDPISDLLVNDSDLWVRDGDHLDIIAYTLGEELGLYDE